MNERVVSEVLRLSERMFTGQQFGVADREDFLIIKQLLRRQSGVVAPAPADTDIDGLAFKIDEPVGRIDHDSKVGAILAELGQTRDQPATGEGGF